MKQPKKRTNNSNSKEVNKEKIFDLFEEIEVKPKGEKVDVKQKDKFKDRPSMKIGMFIKLILNHDVFHSKLEKFLKSEEPSYDVESTKESSEYIVYNRAWSYIKLITPSKKEDLFAILDFNPKLFDKALQNALMYFQNREEYLKCAHIFKIQQILKERK